jgi:hypothetical protein
MPECLPDMPRYVRQRGDEWQGADHQNGPWRPIPKPRGFPCTTDGPAVQSREPASVVTEASPTPADRLALAVCVAALPGSKPCNAPCNACRVNSAAVAHEIARQFRKHYGSSVRADWLDGVGSHTPGGVQSVHP